MTNPLFSTFSLHSHYGTFSHPLVNQNLVFQKNMQILEAGIRELSTIDAAKIEAMPSVSLTYRMVLLSSKLFVAIKILNPLALNQFVLLNQRFHKAMSYAVKQQDFDILAILWMNIVHSELAFDLMMLCLHQNKPQLLEQLLNLPFFKQAILQHKITQREEFHVSVGAFYLRFDASLGTDIVDFCASNPFMNEITLELFPKEISEKLILQAYGFAELSETDAIEVALAL